MAAGNLSYKVQARADDEIGVLVDSFNRMTDDLSAVEAPAGGGVPRPAGQAHRARGPPALHRDGARGHHHRRGVVRSRSDRLTTMNRAAARMFGLDEAASVGRPLEEIFAAPSVREVVDARAADAAAAERRAVERSCTCAAAAPATSRCSPPPPRCAAPMAPTPGAVVVFDDLTELLKAQRLAAWREVAQRIAHEIKNPLTPIQLSAQRLRRRLARGAGRGPAAGRRSAPRRSSRRSTGSSGSSTSSRASRACRPSRPARPTCDRSSRAWPRSTATRIPALAADHAATRTTCRCSRSIPTTSSAPS